MRCISFIMLRAEGPNYHTVLILTERKDFRESVSVNSKRLVMIEIELNVTDT